LLVLSGGTVSQSTPARPGSIVEQVVPSRALERNAVKDSPRRPVQVYLPPGYAERTTRR
jgi:hypothetical protein